MAGAGRDGGAVRTSEEQAGLHSQRPLRLALRHNQELVVGFSLVTVIFTVCFASCYKKPCAA